MWTKEKSWGWKNSWNHDGSRYLGSSCFVVCSCRHEFLGGCHQLPQRFPFLPKCLIKVVLLGSLGLVESAGETPRLKGATCLGLPALLRGGPGLAVGSHSLGSRRAAGSILLWRSWREWNWKNCIINQYHSVRNLTLWTAFDRKWKWMYPLL